MNDDLGDRMKMYESLSEVRLTPMTPTFARIDGRCFSKFTEGMRRPYDSDMSSAMISTAIRLAQETNSCMAYTQSDEITLAWFSPDYKKEIWFAGRHSKMVSQLGALATLYFYQACMELMPERASKNPSFDARVWQTPTLEEGANIFLWREMDATKNSITMAASTFYSHNELMGKSGAEKQEMLFQKGVNWNDYLPSFKRGTYIQKKVFEKPFSEKEIEALPPKHQARFNPNLTFSRSSWESIYMPVFSTVKNRVGVIFSGERPETA